MNKEKKYCMEFTNEEIINFFVNPIKKNSKLKIITLDEDNNVVGELSKKPITCVTFDGKSKDTNFSIIFWGHQTSIFIDDENKEASRKEPLKKFFTFNQEFMFIDDHEKEFYTTSDTDYNVVYEGVLTNKAHKEILEILADFVLILEDVKNLEFEEIEVSHINAYQKCNYIVKIFNDTGIEKEVTFENIRFIVN